jgi:hypothetical protein
MTAQNIRIMKEARALFWPWCAVMLVGLLHLSVVGSLFFSKGGLNFRRLSDWGPAFSGSFPSGANFSIALPRSSSRNRQAGFKSGERSWL